MAMIKKNQMSISEGDEKIPAERFYALVAYDRPSIESFSLGWNICDRTKMFNKINGHEKLLMYFLVLLLSSYCYWIYAN